MPVQSKTFTYEAEGLAYTVIVYEDNEGQFHADISVTEGAMDVNAIYFGDDTFEGESASLDGPLNMNGVRLEGERVQWDEAVQLSDPGLGREGTDKETYVETGETYTVELDITSLDEIDIFGIRATSTTTPEGSIKAVSDDPEEPEEPEDPTYDKVYFVKQFSDTGFPEDGNVIVSEEPVPNTYNVGFLPEGTEPTFENYMTHFEDGGGDLTSLEAIVFYDIDENGNLEELFRIPAPEGGFEDSESLLAIYDELIFGEEAPADADSGEALMALLSLPPEEGMDTIPDEPEMDEDLDLI